MSRVVAVRRADATDHVEIERLRDAASTELAGLRGGEVLLAAVATAQLADHDGGADEVAVLVGTIGDVTVGFARATRRGERADLEELYVEEPARRVGVGHLLLDAAIEWARGVGCRAIDARALPGARNTKNFFEGHGMVSRLLVVARDLDD